MEKLLDFVYYDPSSPACFSGVLPVYREAKKKLPKIKLSDVKSYLDRQDIYSLHRPLQRRGFPRRPLRAAGVDTCWMIDLCDVSRISKYNNGVNFILTVIDVFSHYGFAAPVKRKEGVIVRDAFESILKTSKRKPWRIQSDKGKEFYNKPFQAFLDYQNIQHFSGESDDTKACLVERYNRTVKTRLWKYFAHKNTFKWLGILPKIVTAINHSYNRSRGMRPVDITQANENKLRKKFYPDHQGIVQNAIVKKKPRYKVGDVVRISRNSQVFRKGYLPNYTTEKFVIDKVDKRHPIIYRIKDQNGEAIKGLFYDRELARATGSVGKKSQRGRRR